MHCFALSVTELMSRMPFSLCLRFAHMQFCLASCLKFLPFWVFACLKHMCMESVSYWNPVYPPKSTSPWNERYVSKGLFADFRVWNKICSWSSFFYAKMFFIAFTAFYCFTSPLGKQTYSFSFFPHQTSLGCTLSTPADSGGGGTHAHRSDHSGPVGDTFIGCPSPVPSGPLRVALSRWHLLVHSKMFFKRILACFNPWLGKYRPTVGLN